jgi:hypothetical protein
VLLQACCRSDGVVYTAHEPRGQVWGEAPYSLALLASFQARELEVEGLHHRGLTAAAAAKEGATFWQRWLQAPCHAPYRQQGALVYERIRVMELTPFLTSLD